MATDETAAVSPILSIPLELMKEILESSLIKPSGSNITLSSAGFETHALLKTCKRLRFEALKTFYYKNKFVIAEEENAVEVLIKFFHHLKSLGLKEHLVSLDPSAVGRGLWFNVIQFFQRVHQGSFPGLSVTAVHRLRKIRSRHVKAMLRYFTLAQAKRREPWQRVRREIDCQWYIEAEAIKKEKNQETTTRT
ncbi:Hypothetical predicted protein [Lecanosticta acicola]|uniref:F-box domain-containing protein n=1 Tax=Lecanosticta acicola TaxID=111012 RepID=A0AAI9EAS3_9PEZI|nr:Hypothetical predicted protein [Lecanosticta acicola]